MRLLIAALLGPIVLLSGCATLQVDKAAVGQVKKVAVFAYSTSDMSSQDKPVSKTKVFDKISKVFGGRGTMQFLPADNLAKAYIDTLEKKMQWHVLPLISVRENQAYRQIYNLFRLVGKAKGKQKFGRNDYVAGILGWDDVAKLTPSERTVLIKALDVDAIVKVDIGVRYMQKRSIAIKGIALNKREPRVRIKMALYDKDHEDAIWSDAGNGRGPAFVGAEGISNTKKVERALIQAIHGAVDKLHHRYNKKD